MSNLLYYKSLATNLSCIFKGIDVNGGFCLNKHKKQVGGNNCHDKSLNIKIVEILNYTRSTSIYDFGAGLGQYKKLFVDNGIKYEGYDASPNIEALTENSVHYADLTIANRFIKKDWAMSLEVGEHINKKYEHVFIQNIADSVFNGVILSWAVRGQGGHNHVNTHNPKYIICKMKRIGFEIDHRFTKEIKRSVKRCYWIRRSVNVFVRTADSLEDDEIGEAWRRADCVD